jgi:hypothetical protein
MNENRNVHNRALKSVYRPPAAARTESPEDVEVTTSESAHRQCVKALLVQAGERDTTIQSRRSNRSASFNETGWPQA